jgi:transposase
VSFLAGDATPAVSFELNEEGTPRPSTGGRSTGSGYNSVQKTYSGTASRRIVSELRTAERDGHIDAAPSFNSVLRYTRSPEVTPILHELVTVSSLPLKAVETEFAVDSSGFGTKRTVSWFSKKHGRPMSAREWVKLHLMAGVRTHIVTGVEVTGWTTADSPYLPPLVERTARNFDVREVSADKGYLTKHNVAAIEQAGAVPFMPFKSNSVEPTGDSAWSRMWHYYSFNRSTFLNHYHQRSNVETVFSMIKARFGDDVLSKSDTAQVNEVLCKVIAHNLCVLIQSFYELGIDPTFISREALAPNLAS